MSHDHVYFIYTCVSQTFFQFQTWPVDHYGILGHMLHDMGSNSVCVVDKDRNAVTLTTTVQVTIVFKLIYSFS